jgi:hypothetical protein
MKILGLLMLIPVVIFILDPKALAYVETHPPYSVKEGPYKSLNIKPVIDADHSEYKSPDGKIRISFKGGMDERHWDFLLQDGNSILAKRHIDYSPIPYEIYHVDINGDGQKDFVVLMTYMAMGMSFLHERVEIFLKKKEGGYQQIAYDAVAVSINDFIDLDHDGKCEVIITGFYQQDGTKQDGRTHSYFSYDVYEFDGYRLKNADKKYQGFPKFVWFTERPNDQDSDKVTLKERLKHIQEKEKGIVYKSIK